MIAGPRLKFFTASLALLTWGTSRVLSSGLFEYHMMNITAVIQDSLKRISTKSFDHLHKLDLNYHKIRARNSVFTINRALRSIEGALRFFMGRLTGMMVEFAFLAFAMGAFCGPFYMLNMIATFGLYLKYTKDVSN